MITLTDIQAARERVAPYVIRTPLIADPILSDVLGTNVYLKQELFQRTGSFKPRGAFNQMLNLEPAARERGVVAVSGGNFAQAVAYAGKLLGVRTVICMPAHTTANYVEATKAHGAQVEFGETMQAAYVRAEDFTAQGMTLLHPYENAHQMAGVGVVGLEIYEDVPQLTDVVISIGGGGLIGGITMALKSLKPDVRVWGVETELSATMYESLKAGEIVDITPKSLAKTLGASYVARDALTLMQQHSEGVILVSDQQAIEAQQFILERHKVLTELAASCTLPAAQQVLDRLGKHVVLLLCGGNESLENMIRYRDLFPAT